MPALAPAGIHVPVRASSPPTADTPAPPAPAAAPEPPPIPYGPECLQELDRLEIQHKALSDIRGVETPVDILGPIGGISFSSYSRLPFRCDCRFAIAWSRVAPRLVALGVSELRFSGAYVYRRTRSGNMSGHAYGMAIDIHQVGIHGTMVDVQRDFERGHDEACEDSAATLNKVGCALREAGFFVLDPDSDSDLSNHFHVEGR